MSRLKPFLLIGIAGTCMACDRSDNAIRIPGVIERDRLQLAAEASEPVVKVYVAEGNHVEKDDVLLVQDDTIAAAQLRQAESARDRAAARYQELARGPRVERIAAAQARLKGADDRFVEADAEFQRTRTLRGEGTVSQSQYDDALARLNDIRATREAIAAEVDELLEGTTPEELAQATATLSEAEAAIVVAKTRVERLTVRAPSAGLIEALPFRQGERPRAGDAVVIMLADGPPFVRLYLPSEARPRISAGASASVMFEHNEEKLRGKVRFVSSEAAFTPFFALTEHDRSRLSYLTEVVLIDAAALNLPAGLAVEVFLDRSHPAVAGTNAQVQE